jgi:hypothetical protein
MELFFEVLKLFLRLVALFLKLLEFIFTYFRSCPLIGEVVPGSCVTVPAVLEVLSLFVVELFYKVVQLFLRLRYCSCCCQTLSLFLMELFFKVVKLFLRL